MPRSTMVFSSLLAASSAYDPEAKRFPGLGKVPLGYIGVNDGPLDHSSIELMLDFSSGKENQEHVYCDAGFISDSGHNLYPEYIYGAWGSKDRHIVKVEKKVNCCAYHAYPNGQPVDLVCE